MVRKLNAMMAIFMSIVRANIRQRTPAAIFISLVLLFLAILFSFLMFAPILSPFVYPLF